MKETGQRKPPCDMPRWNAFVEEVLAGRKKPPQAEKRGVASEQEEKGNTAVSIP